MQKDVKRFITDEKLSICAVVETHIKEKQIKKICKFVFGNWNWCSNMKESAKGCRNITGWNEEDVSVMLVHSSHQAILYIVEIQESGSRFFC